MCTILRLSSFLDMNDYSKLNIFMTHAPAARISCFMPRANRISVRLNSYDFQYFYPPIEGGILGILLRLGIEEVAKVPTF